MNFVENYKVNWILRYHPFSHQQLHLLAQCLHPVALLEVDVHGGRVGFLARVQELLVNLLALFVVKIKGVPDVGSGLGLRHRGPLVLQNLLFGEIK